MKNRFARRVLALSVASFLAFSPMLMAEDKPENPRRAYEHLLLVLDSKPKGNLPTHEFLQFCELAAVTQPHLSVEESVTRLDRLRRNDVATFEKANLEEIALAFGSLKAAGKSADKAVPAILKVVAPKSDDTRLGDEFSFERYRALQARLRVFRYAAIVCLSEINLNQHPESLRAILDIFQRRHLRISDYSQTSSVKAEVQLIKTAFSRIDGSNPHLLTELVRGLEFEFNGRLYLLKARRKTASWHGVYDPLITTQLFTSPAKYQSQSDVVPYAFLYLERGGRLVLPAKTETEDIGGAITRYSIASRLNNSPATKRLFAILQRVASGDESKKSKAQISMDGEYQIVLLRILSQSPQNHTTFTKPPFREILLDGLNTKNPPLRAACAMVVARMGEKGAVFVPALVNSLKLRNEADHLMDEQLHNSVLYSDMLGSGRSLMAGHSGKDGRTNATLETIRALQAIGPKAAPAIPVLQLISTEKSQNSNAPWRNEAKAALRKIQNSS